MTTIMIIITMKMKDISDNDDYVADDGNANKDFNAFWNITWTDDINIDNGKDYIFFYNNL